MAASRLILSSAGRLVGEDVALVDPDLHADAAEGGAGLAEAVVDVGPQGVQRHPALAVPLAAAISEPPRRPEHCTRMPWAPAFCAVCTARFMARRKLTRPASWSATPWAIRAASSSGCLISWMLSWTLALSGDLGQVGAQAVGLGAAAADDDAGTGGVHVDAQAVTRALDLDAADGGVRQLLIR